MGRGDSKGSWGGGSKDYSGGGYGSGKGSSGGYGKGSNGSRRVAPSKIVPNRGGGEWGKRQRQQQQMQMKDAKSQREADYFWERQGQLARGGPPRSKSGWQEEKELFDNTAHTAGIDFDKYDGIAVDVSGNGAQEIPPIDHFDDLWEQYELPDFLWENISRCKYKKPTPIQRYAIPVGLNGRDAMCCAQTGSGKTCAFLLPILSCIDPSQATGAIGVEAGEAAAPKAVVLAPTRELCSQIHLEARKLSFKSTVRASEVYGGVEARPQLLELARGVDVVTATPGRLIDFIDRGVMTLSWVGYLVLDEADRMLDMGFEPQIRRAAAGLPRERQTALFSATWPKEVRKLAHEFLTRPIQVRIGEAEETHANVNVTQDVIIVDTTQDKDDALERVLSQELLEPEDKCIIFVSTKQMCRSLAWRLQRPPPPAPPTAGRSPSSPSAGAPLADAEADEEGGDADEGSPPEATAAAASAEPRKPRACAEIHGDKDQRERDQALQSFKDGKTPIMIATDVAGRGLHIEKVKLVVNFDIAGNAEEHVHRIGRTGRAGAKGKSVTFVSRSVPTDLAKVKWLCNLIERAAVEAGDQPNLAPELRELRNSRYSDADLAGPGGGRGWGGGRGKGGKRGFKGSGKAGRGAKGFQKVPGVG